MLNIFNNIAYLPKCNVRLTEWANDICNIVELAYTYVQVVSYYVYEIPKQLRQFTTKFV